MDDSVNGTNAKNVRIIFFAKARELSGVNESRIVVDGPLSCAELVATVIEQFGLQSIRDTLILAVNEEFVEREAVLDLNEGDEIAVIPPLSGDNTIFPNGQKQSESKNESKNCKEKLEYGGENNDDRVAIDPSQVQIRADNEELNRRIESFIARKRQQVNAVNVQEFCSHRYLSDESEVSCARVDAILIRRKDSKSHVKVHRVLNSRGPQTMDPLMLFAESSKSSNRDSSEVPEYPGLEERLAITEKYIGISKPVPKNVYERIKNIEDRVLHLESISPEYKDFWVSESTDILTSPRGPVRKRTFSTAELDNKLLELEDRYAKKMK